MRKNKAKVRHNQKKWLRGWKDHNRVKTSTGLTKIEGYGALEFILEGGVRRKALRRDGGRRRLRIERG